MQAVVAGETQFSFENPASSLPLVQAGNVRGLASTSETRGSQTPDLPTMIEAGVPDFTSVSFTAVVAPAGTPAAIVARLNAAINESLKSPEIGATLTKLSVDARIPLAGGVRRVPRPGAREVGDRDQDRRRAGGVSEE